MSVDDANPEPIVITGIGMITSVGRDRETTWAAVKNGMSGVRLLKDEPGVSEGMLIGAPVDMGESEPHQLRVINLSQHTAAEAISDSQIDLGCVDLDRFGCAISGHMGDTGWIDHVYGADDRTDTCATQWWHQWMPNTACSAVANQFGLFGPRISHSTACASGLIDILAAVRSIRDNQCDIALAGSSETFHPLFAAGFRRMGVLADHDDPTQACRPFDRERSGFVMGEGSAMFILERLSHAQRRGAKIYATITAGKMHAEAHHVTNLDAESESLAHLITETLRAASLDPLEVDYINAHATGTAQNDVGETRGIRRALGKAADELCVSGSKSMLGHLVNASGSVELALTALTLRDGFASPTINLTEPDKDCDLDCIPLVGRPGNFQNAIKLSIAFGGHLVAVTLQRWNGPHARESMSFKRAA